MKPYPMCIRCNECRVSQRQYKLCDDCHEKENPSPTAYDIQLDTNIGSFHYNIEAHSVEEARQLAENELINHLSSENCGWIDIDIN